MLRFTQGGIWHNDRHLVYPPMGAELPGVFATPDSYFNKDSTWYGWGDIPQAGGVVQSLLALTPNGNPAGNDDGTQLAQILSDKQLLGNALMLTQAMYDHQKNGKPLPDFNLDGDRGYGFLFWSQHGDPSPDFPNPLVSETNPAAAVPLNFIR